MIRHDIAVLANPLAGRGRHRDVFPEVFARLQDAGATVRLVQARTGDEASQACHRAIADGTTVLVAVGGDGTVHAALQAVAGTLIPLAVVPTGTGNDFAAGVGVPADPLIAVDGVVAALKAGTTHPIDLARIVTDDGDTRWYGGVLAAGFDAMVNERANRMRHPRGPRRYDLAIALELARLHSWRYTLRLDGELLCHDGVLVAVGNCPSYGGGMRICPDADPTDGLLDVVLAAPLGRARLALLRPRLREGTHVGDPRVSTYLVREVRLEAYGIVGYADGERVAPLPLTVTCVLGALRLLR